MFEDMDEGWCRQNWRISKLSDLLDVEYESPIETSIKEWHKVLDKNVEDCVMQAVHEVGVQVDREELIKALQGDREQYDKGFNDGQIFALKSLFEYIFENSNTSDTCQLYGIITEIKIRLHRLCTTD